MRAVNLLNKTNENFSKFEFLNCLILLEHKFIKNVTKTCQIIHKVIVFLHINTLRQHNIFSRRHVEEKLTNVIMAEQ